MGVPTELFLATEAELRQHYPSRRVPLDEPVSTTRTNPFTRKAMVHKWDPSPEVEVEEERVGPPSPSIDCKGLGLTSVEGLMHLVLGVAPPQHWNRPALIGPSDGPWIHEVPRVVVQALAALDEPGRARITTAWSAREGADAATISNARTREAMLRRDEAYWRGYLDRVADFAREGLAQKRGLYLWMST